jgi:GNAT superfamily N-acetyltransferase
VPARSSRQTRTIATKCWSVDEPARSARTPQRESCSVDEARCAHDRGDSGDLCRAVEERAHRLRQQTGCAHPESDSTSGLVAYLDGEPVGWCAVESRSAYEGLVRNARVPWEGREEDKTDESVWAVGCLLTRAGFRRRGVSRELARAAVDFARGRGAGAIEAYPMTTKNVIAEELHGGTEGVFDRPHGS